MTRKFTQRRLRRHRSRDFSCTWKPQVEGLESRLLLATIRGQIFQDDNANGMLDAPQEAALEGWSVYLDLDGSGTFDVGEPTFETGPNGEYEFTDVTPGTYSVRQVAPSGWEQAYPYEPELVDDELIPVENRYDHIFDPRTGMLYISSTNGRLSRFTACGRR